MRCAGCGKRVGKGDFRCWHCGAFQRPVLLRRTAPFVGIILIPVLILALLRPGGGGGKVPAPVTTSQPAASNRPTDIAVAAVPTPMAALTPEPSQIATAAPTLTPSPIPTPSSTPMPTPSPTPAPAPTQVTDSVTMTTAGISTAPAGQGTIRIGLQRVTGPVSGQYFVLCQQRTDVTGNIVQGDCVTSGNTDDTGTLTFNVPPGEYLVTSNLTGYNWGNATQDKGLDNVSVKAAQTTTLDIKLGKLVISLATVDHAIDGQHFVVCLKKKDANGNNVPGDCVNGGNTDNTGTLAFDLTPGDYIVTSDLTGYNWGDLTGTDGVSNVKVEAGTSTNVDPRFGRLAVTVRSADGNVVSGAHVVVCTETKDANGKAIVGNCVTGGNTGVWQTDLTPGSYALTTQSQTLFDVTVEPSKTTQSNMTP